MGLIHSQETKVLNVTQYGKKKRKKITVMGQIPWFLRENRKEKGKEGGKEGEGGMGGRKEGKR